VDGRDGDRVIITEDLAVDTEELLLQLDDGRRGGRPGRGSRRPGAPWPGERLGRRRLVQRQGAGRRRPRSPLRQQVGRFGGK
jgi:hypothetical protein